MLRLSAMACFALLTACGQPESSSPALASGTSAAASPATVARPVLAMDPAAPAHFDGYGDTRFGMDEATFDQAWGGELKGAPEQDSTCFYKSPRSVRRSADFAFMLEDGRFVRYDVGTAGEAAPGGGKVGMDGAQIRALYGARVSEQPHKYVEGAKYLRIAAPQGNGVLLFETDEQGKVTRWHVGVPPQVDYVEGCG